MRRRRLLAAPAAVLALALAGCGLGSGSASKGVSVRVTRDFGAHTVGLAAHPGARSSDTQMRLLERSFRISTRYGGGYVESIDGLSGGFRDGHRYDWFYYVNGREASRGAAGTGVHDGDQVLWDLHDWTATQHVPAIVGQFPEPFLHGTGGKRPPLRLECASDATAACNVAAARLQAVGIPAFRAVLGAPAGRDVARILVGQWADVRGDEAASQLVQGPAVSGVYALPVPGSFALLDPSGRVVRKLKPGGGLVAATAFAGQQPTWLVLGVDAAGTKAAAAALTPSALAGRFAAAVGGDLISSVPVVAG